MKRVLVLLTLALFLTSIVSAEMLLKEQPRELYNLGEVVKVPIKITTNLGIDEFFSLNLICNGLETEVHKQYVFLSPGEEQDILIAIPLITSFIGRATGTCTGKAIIGDDFLLTNDFVISNIITTTLDEFPESVAPEKSILIEGTAVKANGQNVDGFMSFILGGGSLEENIEIADTVKNGYFHLNTSLPKDTAAGEYSARVDVYEQDKYGNKSNDGFVDFTLTVTQVPTSLELMIDDKTILPGDSLQIKPVLHDQTGVSIGSNVKLTIKDQKDKIIEQTEIPTDEYYEFPIEDGYPPSNWSISISSKDFEVDDKFYVGIKETAQIDIINNTVIMTNTGNVNYNETAIIKLGNDTLNIDAYIPIGEARKYTLTAPDGEYEVEVISEDGDNRVSKTVMLTGNAISINELNEGILNKVKFSIVWIFIIAVLGFMVMVVHKKGYKRAFIGYIQKKRKVRSTKVLADKQLVIPKDKAEMSLSIKGDSQNVSIVTLKIKSSEEVKKNEMARQTLQEAVEIAEQHKAHTYQSGNNIIFILAPTKTKTFQNQKAAVTLAQSVKSLLDSYNKLAKTRIKFGLSLNFGTIIAKLDKESMKFMSMGSLLSNAKKLAEISEGEVLLTEKIRDKLMSHVKTEKKEKAGTKYYIIKQVIQKSAENEKFIHNFIRKLEKENKEAKAKKKPIRK